MTHQSTLDFIMGNPLLSEIGWGAEYAYSVVAIATAALCGFHAQQIYQDPYRRVPWCHLRRFGLAILIVTLLASAVHHGDHAISFFHALSVLGVLFFVAGLVFQYESGLLKRNKVTSAGVLK